MKTLAVIPARGGSKGIPRKNLRPLNGKPLIYYSINAAFHAQSVDRVVVTTDDDEIALFAERFGAHVIRRPSDLANDASTLDPVIIHAVNTIEAESSSSFDLVVTVQPTSPLVRSVDIDNALRLFDDSSVGTVLSVVDDRHLSWTIVGGRPSPKYEQRVNRQQLLPNYKETGAIIACRRSQLNHGTRIGQNVALYEMPHERSFDIDSLADLYLCEAMLAHKRIVLTAVGRPALGMGHAYRVALLAHELVHHELVFVCEEADQLACDYLKNLNYPVHLVPSGDRLGRILELEPHLVINDILDTELAYVQSLKAVGIRTVNFEDMGPGADEADLVVNALYPHQVPSERHLVGARYFCLRDEFLYLPEFVENETIKRVLLTFGGTDENNLSARTLEAILPECTKNGIAIDLVVGPGFRHQANVLAVMQASGYSGIQYVSSTARISDYMVSADLAMTSGGRTVFELTSIGVPTIVICQNEREMTHSFASSEHGIINLGLCHKVTPQTIVEAFVKVVRNKELRQTMRHKMQAVDLSGGKARVIGEITALLSGVGS